MATHERTSHNNNGYMDNNNKESFIDCELPGGRGAGVGDGDCFLAPGSISCRHFSDCALRCMSVLIVCIVTQLLYDDNGYGIFEARELAMFCLDVPLESNVGFYCLCDVDDDDDTSHTNCEGSWFRWLGLWVTCASDIDSYISRDGRLELRLSRYLFHCYQYSLSPHTVKRARDRERDR